MAKIFISYRREDSASISGRIYDRLVARLGPHDIFKDVDNIPAGVNFGAYIQDSLRQCTVALVIIGRHWLDAQAEEGARRLDDPQDWVRQEVETAFLLGLTVIPVLVEGAQLPRAVALPSSLQQLPMINSMQVRADPDFTHDMGRLLVAIEHAIAMRAPRQGSWPGDPAITPLTVSSSPGQGLVTVSPPYPAPMRPYPVATQAPAIASAAGTATLSPRRSARVGVVLLWGLAIGIVPFLVAATVEREIDALGPVDFTRSMWSTVLPIGNGCIAVVTFFVAGFFAARRMGNIRSSMIAAAAAFSPWVLLLPVALSDPLTLLLILGLIIICIPMGALGGAIGIRGKRPTA
jgi:hypothetical protein